MSVVTALHKRIAFLLLIQFLISFETKAQSMKAIEILQNLIPYEELLHELQERAFPSLEQNGNEVTFAKRISSSYSFITLGLYREASVVLQVRFETVRDTIVFKELYVEDAQKKEALTTFVRENKRVCDIPWRKEVKNDFYHSKEVTDYLSQADEIAAIAVNYASGDSYRPGAFSEIEIEEDGIRLSQINHMNAKSLSHKENYSLRELEFFIPFEKGQEIKRRWQEYRLGEMRIQFSDRSSKNNKPCGDEIEKKIVALGAKQD